MGNILYAGGCVSCVVGRVLCTVGYLLCAVGLILCTVGYLLESMGRALAPPASCACAAGLVSSTEVQQKAHHFFLFLQI